MLTKLKHYVPQHILYSLYCTLVLPYINYGILIWGNTYNTYLSKIHRLQKWAVRTISFEHYRCHSNPLFKKHKILNVYDTFKLDLGVFMYKHHAELLPKVFINYFRKHNQYHNYTTRNAQNYSFHNAKKTFSDRSIRTSGPVLWNSIDKKLKQARTVKEFRNMFKTNLLETYNYILTIH